MILLMAHLHRYIDPSLLLFDAVGVQGEQGSGDVYEVVGDDPSKASCTGRCCYVQGGRCYCRRMC